MKVILASNSPYKRAQLDSLQIDYVAVDPQIEENHSSVTSIKEHAIQLAEIKAKAVLDRNPKALVIGSDQTAALNNGELLTKPLTFENATHQLTLSSGNEAVFYSAVCIKSKHAAHSWAVETRVTFRQLSHAEITRYLQKDSPLNCAGSFKVESLGISLFEKVTSDDPTALVGLPLISLSNKLRGLSINIP